MPEGHTIHRHARLQAKALGGQALRVSSPQGEESDIPAAEVALEAARILDGRTLERIEAYGKHLFYRFEGERSLHVHLGLFGRFRTHKEPIPPPRGAVRLRFDAGSRAVDLSGATSSKLIVRGDERRLRERLGPDPLRADADPEVAWAKLKRRRTPISAALMDQSVIAGIGNVYRAEILFACGVRPSLPSNKLSRPRFDAIWETTVAMLRLGERSGRIITVPASEADVPPSKLRGRERVQVYRRERCRRCGGPVRTKEVAARTLYWCPAEQKR
ncbi:Fpg/Nei family DNA glycosylase [Thermoleophilia bacterium SCSIO 60948]|nr:Fpg/Nei family DNA glycosylase [Thermoleophilia bacterium SCSIO 60948]